jgi:hypothetical protein
LSQGFQIGFHLVPGNGDLAVKNSCHGPLSISTPRRAEYLPPGLLVFHIQIVCRKGRQIKPYQNDGMYGNDSEAIIMDEGDSF